MSTKLTPLVPPDKRQCQALKPRDITFMSLGGRTGERVRCTNKPTVIATEQLPGRDGRKGSMALCDSCAEQLVNQCGKDFAIFEPLKGLL